MLQMKSNRYRLSSVFFRHAGYAAVAGMAFALAGCASAPTAVKMEPKSVAKQLGLQGCRVSVPLSQAEVISDAKRTGNPNPEAYREWTEITANIQPGDQLRLVNCLESRSKDVGNPYYYALVRNDAIILKFHVGFFD
ncbi:MAG TPA: hypothetical protein VJ806_15855 [Luteimonas sp.]|nr:hypothetical protein [Luteimonas sp.]